MSVAPRAASLTISTHNPWLKIHAILQLFAGHCASPLRRVQQHPGDQEKQFPATLLSVHVPGSPPSKDFLDGQSKCPSHDSTHATWNSLQDMSPCLEHRLDINSLQTEKRRRGNYPLTRGRPHSNFHIHPNLIPLDLHHLTMERICSLKNCPHWWLACQPTAISWVHVGLVRLAPHQNHTTTRNRG